MMNYALDIAKSSPLIAVRPPDLVTRLPRRSFSEGGSLITGHFDLP